MSSFNLLLHLCDSCLPLLNCKVALLWHSLRSLLCISSISLQHMQFVLCILSQTHFLLKIQSRNLCLQYFILDTHLKKLTLWLCTLLSQCNKLIVIFLYQVAKRRELVVVSVYGTVHIGLQNIWKWLQASKLQIKQFILVNSQLILFRNFRSLNS